MLKIFFVMVWFIGLGFAKIDSKNEEFKNVASAKKWSNRVFLATYPRCGNEWMRRLIEEATGVVTSSVYQEFFDRGTEMPESFEQSPWGAYSLIKGFGQAARYPKWEEPIVIKTHFPAFEYKWLDVIFPYSHAIRIVRHPVDSFYSYYLLIGGKECFIPRKELQRMIVDWRRFHEYWNRAKNVLTFRYEDLYMDPHFYLKLILDKIGYVVSQEDIERAVAKNLPRGGLLKHFDHFTEEDFVFIHNELKDLMDQFQYDLKTFRCHENSKFYLTTQAIKE